MRTDGPAPDPRRALRKDEHLELALHQRGESANAAAPRPNEFDDVRLLHHALVGIDAGEVRLDTALGPWTWSVPFIINGMTGGTDRTDRINRALAEAAEETGTPLAVGSMSIALDDPGAARGFRALRAAHPRLFLMANLGAGRPGADAARAVDLIAADALQIHLNPVQETVMSEGARDLGAWSASLSAMIAASPVPVIVKEVGFGLSRRTLRALAGLGVRIADVGGVGGTDFLEIENRRRAREGRSDYGMLAGHGQSTIACLLDAPPGGPELIASGGIRHPFDAVKALAAGARAVGVAGAFLTAAERGGAAELVRLIEEWRDQLVHLLALLGAASPAELAGQDLLVGGRAAEYCERRGIDLRALASRSGEGPERDRPEVENR